MPKLPEQPVFTIDDALRCGWTVTQLHYAAKTNRVLRLRRGIYGRVGADVALQTARAAALCFPDALVSHRSAVLLHGLPLLGARPPRPELTVRPRSNASLAGVHVHRATPRPEDVTCVDGVAVTSVARTLVDLARHRSTAAAVAAIDHALHRGLVTTEDLADVLTFCWTWPRIRRAQRAVRLADGRAESPLESVSRLALRWIGLPAPELQRTVFDQDGQAMGRVDFYWDDYGVAGEADGRAKFDSATAHYRVGGDPLNAEKDRQDAMESLHVVFARWRWEHTTWQRYELRERVLRAFARGRALEQAGVPRLWA